MLRLRLLILLSLAALLTAGLVACGGGGNNEDPAQVVNETFAAGKNYKSGVIDVALTAQGQSSQTPAFDISAKGPFQSSPGGFPQFDLAATIKGTVPFSGGLVSTGNAAFVKVGSTNYSIDQTAFNTYKQYFLALSSTTGKASSAGVQPSGFFTNLKNEGTQDVNGTKAIHISGQLDIDKLVAAAKLASSGQQGSSQKLDAARAQIGGIKIDLFSDETSKRVVKLEVNVTTKQTTTAPPGTVKFSLGFSNLGQPQTITAPPNPQPLGNLLQLLQSRVNSAGGGGSGSGASGAGGTPTVPSSGQANAYTQCLAQAKGTAALQACNKLLPH